MSATDKIFAIGDIHGCADELEALLKKLPLTPTSTIIFLGDYVDRGNQSRRVIDIIIEFRKTHRVIALRGNHEEMLLEFLDRPEDAGMFIFNGGSATLASYSRSDGGFEIPPEHLQFFRSLRDFHETDKYFFVHGGVPDRPFSEIDPVRNRYEFLWIREEFLNSDRDWGKIIIHGHTPVPEPEVLPNRINIDTGCIFDNCLTAVELPSQKFYSVPKQRVQEAPLFLKDLDTKRVATRFSGALKVSIERPSGPLELETLNFNQFGLLVREDAKSNGGGSFSVGDEISGFIARSGLHRAKFTGFVVRENRKGSEYLYGIRIDAIDIPGEKL